MYVYTVWRSSQADPKSIILMIGLSRFFSKIFSGFKSQCINRALFNKLRPFSSCCAKTRTSVVLSPLNWFCLINSYRLTLNSSKTRQRCCRWMKVSFSRRRWWSSFLSSFVLSYGEINGMSHNQAKFPLTRSSTDTSIILWLKYAVLFLTTFTATTSCVFKFWHLTTCPKVPWPRTSRIRYRFLRDELAFTIVKNTEILTSKHTYDQSPQTRECHSHKVYNHYPRYQIHHS